MVGQPASLMDSKPVTLDVKFNRKGARKGTTFTGFSATGALVRTDWGMNFLAKFVGPKVDIFLEVLAIKQAIIARILFTIPLLRTLQPTAALSYSIRSSRSLNLNVD